MEYFNSTEYVICEGGGKYNNSSPRSLGVRAVSSFTSNFNWGSILTRNPAIGFLTTMGFRRVMSDERTPQYFKGARVNTAVLGYLLWLSSYGDAFERSVIKDQSCRGTDVL
ncbi:hypothetical protein TNCV_3252111 [Trichonephila clavipes]|nr:hypothetical protein TNCV_3252111 [Trichonephila clavipes]